MSIQLHGLARLGRDAETRQTPNGESVANLSLAFNYGRKGDDGKKPTQWVDGALWGKLAEALEPYLKKGTQVAVTVDDAHVESFTKNDGTVTQKLTGRVSSIELAGGPSTAIAPVARKATRDSDDDIPF